jgi:hypothetical protein
LVGLLHFAILSIPNENFLSNILIENMETKKVKINKKIIYLKLKNNEFL